LLAREKEFTRAHDTLGARAPALAFPLPRRRALAAVSPATGPAAAEASEPDAQRSGRPFLAPRCAALCQVAMGMTMGYMLIMLL
jgi:hypothetical protein